MQDWTQDPEMVRLYATHLVTHDGGYEFHCEFCRRWRDVRSVIDPRNCMCERWTHAGHEGVPLPADGIGVWFPKRATPPELLGVKE